jgi:hypothetical protein
MLVNPENVFDIARGITEVLLNDELRQELIVKGPRGRPRASAGRARPGSSGTLRGTGGSEQPFQFGGEEIRRDEARPVSAAQKKLDKHMTA